MRCDSTSNSLSSSNAANNREKCGFSRHSKKKLHSFVLGCAQPLEFHYFIIQTFSLLPSHSPSSSTRLNFNFYFLLLPLSSSSQCASPVMFHPLRRVKIKKNSFILCKTIQRGMIIGAVDWNGWKFHFAVISSQSDDFLSKETQKNAQIFMTRRDGIWPSANTARRGSLKCFNFFLKIFRNIFYEHYSVVAQ